MPSLTRLVLLTTAVLSLYSPALFCKPASESALGASADLLQGVRIGRHPDKTRLVFDIKRLVNTRYTPRRDALVLELGWNAETPALKPPRVMTNLNLTDTAVSSVALEQQEGGGVRITIALPQPAKSNSFALKPHENRPYRHVVDVFSSASQGEQATTSQSADMPLPRKSPGEPKENATTRPEARSVAAAAAVRSVGSKVNPAPPSQPASRSPKPTVLSFSATWEHEWAVNSVSGGSQKFESTLEPEWNARFANGIKATVVGRVRLDGVGDLGPDAHKSFNYSPASAPLYNTQAGSLTLRELYFDIPLSTSYLRLGKQQVVWGESDGIKVLDVVNPQSFREFILDDFDDSRIPLWMANWELPLGTVSNLQMLWIPDLSYDELAEVGTPFFVTSAQLVPDIGSALNIQVLEPEKPNNVWRDADWGLKLSSLIGNWDVSLQYLYQYGDTPAFYSYQDDDLVTVVDPRYERSHLAGTTFSNTFSAFTVRAELAYKSDTFQISQAPDNGGIANSREFSSVLGLDWQASSEVLVSAQWFYSYLFDYDRAIVRDESEQLASLLLQSDFDNASWQLQALGLYSLNNRDSLFQIKLRYWLNSNMEIWLGSDVFHGTARGIFGQFDQQDRVLMGFTYGF